MYHEEIHLYCTYFYKNHRIINVGEYSALPTELQSYRRRTVIGGIREAFKAIMTFSPVIWRQKVYLNACGDSS